MNTLTAVISGRRKLMVVELVAKVVLAFGIGLATSIALAGVVLLLAHDAHAAELVPMKPAQVQQGTLLLKSEGSTLAVPAVATEAEIKVSGIVARAVVRQTYRNPYDAWFEGIYVFPLPENAAVDHLRMKIGRRVIEGDIKERQAARAQYEQAKSSGQRAALVEQERPNIFTTNVANIPPRGEITVEIEYQQTLKYDSGSFSLRFPMVVGPRYIPGKPTEGQGHGWSPNTDQVPDAARITPPVLHPDHHAPSNPVRLKVLLDAGVPLARVDSPYHPVTMREVEGGGRIVELAAGEVPANKDFELKWTPVAGHAPQAALFTEKHGGQQFALLMVMPPAKEVAAARLPREVIFVIDTSGSMSGSSIVQAKEALELAVSRLAEQDSFNVIEFNSYAKALYPDARPASAANRGNAVQFVRKLQAQGGTEMALALNLALNGRENPGRVRQVIFLTDGAVGNEDGLFKLIKDKLGDSRLFTVGIGSAPNSHFMGKAAQTGRGTFTYIGKIEEVKEKMGGLFAKLESPVLKGIEIAWPGAVEAWPKRVPDLYLGEPIVVSAALDRAEGEIKISGLRGDAPWQATLPLADARSGRGMGVLWAREKIQSHIDSLRDGGKEEEVRDAVVDIALAHHLVSKYTSLVAVDKTPVRPKEDELKSGAIPTNLPEGWEYDKVFGELPQGATDSLWNLLAGFLTLLLAIGLTVTARRQPLALGGSEMKSRLFAAGRPLLQNHDWPLGVECAWPSAILPAKTVGAASTPRWKSRLLRAAALATFCLALWQLGQGSYIQAKAWLAQVLIKQAWARTLEGEQQAKPWPWADTWPVARISVPGRDIERYVLAGANGRTIAFGPGHVFGTPLPGEAGNSVIGAHRDTHFAFLRELQPDEEIVVQKSVSRIRRYRVEHSEIVDKSETGVLAQPPGETRLTLITCYPFDALRAGGPLRYVVTAKAI